MKKKYLNPISAIITGYAPDKDIYVVNDAEKNIIQKIKTHQEKIWELDQKLMLLESKYLYQKTKLLNKIGQNNLEIFVLNRFIKNV